MIRLCAALALCAGMAGAQTPLPFDVGGPFALTDQTGAARTEADPAGRLQLLFFGYANCEQICSAALPLMAEVADLMAARGVDLVPVMITVDPEADTVAALGPALAQHRAGFVGLTGTPEELQAAYDAFSVEKELLFTDTAGKPVYSHGSFLYLLDGAGKVLTLLPPVLGPDELAAIVTRYAG